MEPCKQIQAINYKETKRAFDSRLHFIASSVLEKEYQDLQQRKISKVQLFHVQAKIRITVDKPFNVKLVRFSFRKNTLTSRLGEEMKKKLQSMQ